VTYGAMGRVRKRWGGTRGHGQAQGAMGRPTGSCTGAESGKEVSDCRAAVGDQNSSVDKFFTYYSWWTLDGF